MITQQRNIGERYSYPQKTNPWLYIWQIQLQQKMNPKIQMLKLSKSKKKIKETEYSEPKNYWNKTNYICLSDYTTKKYRERWVTFKRIICGYSC